MRRRAQRGQSIVEFMLAAPMLSLFLLGALDTGVYLADRITAEHAVRQGGRIAAELGGSNTNGPGTTQLQIDQRVVGDVQAVAAALNYSYIQEIDIYQVTSPDGSMQNTDRQDQFDGSGVAMATQTFTLDQRTQVPPNETLIGVRLVWVYSPPTGAALTQFTNVDYAIFRASPWRLV